MSNIVHLRKLFKFEIYCRAPGWNKLAPNNTYIHYSSSVLSNQYVAKYECVV